MRLAQVEKDYVGLRDLATERRAKLDDALKLFMLNREVDDLEQWIAEREVIAGSQELGQVGVIFPKPNQNESHENTGNDRYSGHGYSEIDRFSGTKPPDDAILFTVSGITAIVEQKLRKFRFFS